jgi:hypothetical protein
MTNNRRLASPPQRHFYIKVYKPNANVTVMFHDQPKGDGISLLRLPVAQ